MEGNQKLRILFVEDLPTDVELAERELKRSNLAFTSIHVETKEDFLDALKNFHPDLIISDYLLPEFDGLKALKLSLEFDPTIPFIIATGSMNEDIAVACMKAGATDYVIKGHITRLPFAVRDALEQRQARIKKENAERKLRESEERFRAIIENSSDGIWLINANLKIVYSSPATFHILGYPSEELTGQDDWLNLVHPDDKKNARNIFQEIVAKPGNLVSTEFRLRTKYGDWRWLEIVANNFLDKPGFQAIVINYRDITERKLSAQQIEFQAHLLNAVGQAVIATDLKGSIIYCNHFAEILYGWPAQEMLGRNTLDFISVESQGLAFEIVDKLSRDLFWSGELYVRNRDGRTFPAFVTDTPLVDDKGGLVGIIGVSVDITERKQAEEVLRHQLVELEAIQTVSTAMRTVQTLNEALPILLEKTLSTLNTDTGMIWLYQPESDELLAVATCGLCAPRNGLITKPGKGIIGTVFSSGQEYFVKDLANDPLAHRFTDMNLSPDTGGYFIPIRTDFEVVGVIFMLVPAPDNLTPDQRKLLISLVGMAGNTIHRLDLFEETKEYASQLSMLYDAGLAINSVLEPGQQLKFLFTIAMNTLNADQAAFFRYKLIPDDLVFELGLGFNTESLAALRNLRFQAKDDEDQSVGWVSKNRIPLNLTELTSLSLGPKVDSRILSELYVPIQHDKHLIGVLGVFSPRGKAFSRQGERLLLLFANQAAVAIQNAHLLSEIRRHLEYLNALHIIDTAISGSFNLPHILNVVLEQVKTQLEVDAACLLLFNPDLQALEYAAGRGFHTEALQKTLLKGGEGYAGRAFQERRIINIPNLHGRDTGYLRSPNFSAEKFIAYYAIPLIAKNEVLGVLEIFQRSPLNPEREWLDFLETMAGQAAIAINNTQLFDSLKSANQDLALAYDKTIEGWSRALDLRDKETEGHTLRVTEMTRVLAQEIGINKEELVHIRRGCLLHDIGKLGVPDNILLKPGTLTDYEWDLMKKHPTYAYDMISPIEFLEPAIDIPYCHHEKWDGSGYPRGLRGEDIPISARIFAIVDVWDALTSDRVYRPAWSKKEASTYIQEQSEKQFDPFIVEKFLTFLGE